MDRERLPGESRSQRCHWAVRVTGRSGSFVPKVSASAYSGEPGAREWASRNHIPGGYKAEVVELREGEGYFVDGKEVKHGETGRAGDNLHHHGPSVSPRFTPDQDIF